MTAPKPSAPVQGCFRWSVLTLMIHAGVGPSDAPTYKVLLIGAIRVLRCAWSSPRGPGRTSWTLPLDAVRLGPADDATDVTAAQLRDVVARITAFGQWEDGDPDILVVLDAGYDLTRLAWLLADLPLEILGRLRSDRVMHCPAPALPARLLAADVRLPWQQPCRPGRLTPAHVRRGYRSIRQKLPVPASAPKPSRPGPGRPAGSKNQRPATHCDVGKTVKRTEPKTKNQQADSLNNKLRRKTRTAKNRLPN